MSRTTQATAEPLTAAARAEAAVRAARAQVADLERRLDDAAGKVEMIVDAIRPHKLAAAEHDAAAIEKIAELQRAKAKTEDKRKQLAVELDEARAAVSAAEAELAPARAEDALAAARELGALLIAEGEKIDKALIEIRETLERREAIALQMGRSGCLPVFVVSGLNDASRLNTAVRAARAQKMFIGTHFQSSSDCQPLAVNDRAALERLDLPRPRQTGRRVFA